MTMDNDHENVVICYLYTAYHKYCILKVVNVSRHVCVAYTSPLRMVVVKTTILSFWVSASLIYLILSIISLYRLYGCLCHAQLSNTEEMLGGEFCGNLGEVLIRYVDKCIHKCIYFTIRCNNVLYVQELPDSAQSAPTVTKTDVQEQQMTVE